MFLATVNSGTLLIALPDVERALGTSLLTLVWVILAYMVASTVLLLPAGRLADQLGRRRLFVAGMAVFTLASLGAGFADSGTALILWRIVQGVGGAFVFANPARWSPTPSRARSSASRWARTPWSPPWAW